jgi:hypothetical protein
MQLLFNYFHLYRFTYVYRFTLRPGEMMYCAAFSMMALNYNKSLIYFEKDDNCKLCMKYCLHVNNLPYMHGDRANSCGHVWWIYTRIYTRGNYKQNRSIT